ncbi:MAG: DUF3881 family protein [Parasporobacterium sp.]|nr:DUF3881 family protein [Parasporobacterium sp.]
MHNYLRAIGFSEYLTKSRVDTLLNMVIESPYVTQRINSVGEESLIEIRREFGEGFGLMVHGVAKKDQKIEVEYYFPYITGKSSQETKEILIEKHISKTSFAGACDDYRVGVSLVFYLQNAMEYIDSLVHERFKKGPYDVKFSALSTSGTILFPIQKTQVQINNAKKDLRNRQNLMAAAKEGDTEAIETLTLDELDTVSKISRRILKEDVFTIVESTFMPYGVECDLYSVIGEIVNISKQKNDLTDEEVYILTLDCNSLIFDVGINAKDLLGEPRIGRRFKGPIWLQGYVDFEKRRNKNK